jgi:hypothetical protein
MPPTFLEPSDKGWDGSAPEQSGQDLKRSAQRPLRLLGMTGLEAPLVSLQGQIQTLRAIRQQAVKCRRSTTLQEFRHRRRSFGRFREKSELQLTHYRRSLPVIP